MQAMQRNAIPKQVYQYVCTVLYGTINGKK